jgi:hypothetical protein
VPICSSVTWKYDFFNHVSSSYLDNGMAAAVQPPQFRPINIDDSEAVISDNPQKIYEEYNLLRTTCPVAYTNRYNGFWLLTR